MPDDRSGRGRMPTAQQMFEAGALANRPAKYNQPELPFDEDEQLGLFPEADGTPASERYQAVSMVEPEEDHSNPDARPAPLSVIPTATTNPARPRTLAAGYDKQTRTLTVMFRDGTLYNYYDVLPLEWSNFARSRSKGRFIYTYLDAHARGFADEGSLGEVAKTILANVAAQAQLTADGRQPGHSASSTRGGVGAYGPGNTGGTSRRRVLNDAVATYYRNR